MADPLATTIINSMNTDVWPIVKIGYLIITAIFMLFALVVIRQIYLMTNTLYSGLNIPLKVLGFLFLGVTIFIFFFALAIL